MHILLDSIDKVEIKLMLRHFIKGLKIFYLGALNTCIRNYCYSDHNAKLKPQEILAQGLDHGSPLRQTAASMKVLLFSLPFLYGYLIPSDDDHWQNFIRLLQINILCFVAVLSQRSCNTLEDLFSIINAEFIRLSGNQSLFSKLHYLIHLPKPNEAH